MRYAFLSQQVNSAINMPLVKQSKPPLDSTSNYIMLPEGEASLMHLSYYTRARAIHADSPTGEDT